MGRIGAHNTAVKTGFTMSEQYDCQHVFKSRHSD